MEKRTLMFPDGFLWGASTSAHQVEGNTRNDWSEWEEAHAPRLALDAERHWEAWQEEKFPEMFRADNYISGRAADHYNRYEEDFDIAKELGHNVHRPSVEWSRIEPEEGKFDENEIEHYKDVIHALRRRGIEPMITLWHWTIPLWLRDKGGWQSPDAVFYFERYARKLARAFGGDVTFWITLNEPEIWASHAHLSGVWPPQKRNPLTCYGVYRTLAEAHRRAYGAIKDILPAAQVGIVKDNIYFDSAPGRINRFLKNTADWYWNNHFLNLLGKKFDFIGLNHYFHNRIDLGFNKNANVRISDIGWELYPQSIYHALVELKRYRKPIYVTEHGLADRDDVQRAWFIRESLAYVHRAIEAGVDVRGYMHWSLLDNFEWDKGYWPRFGLVEVDYETLERRVRPSAYEYADICKRNSLTI